MKEYFKIGKINYEGPKSTNPLAFKYYNKDEVVLGKKMSEHLKFAMSWWHTLCAKGSDQFGGRLYSRQRGGEILCGSRSGSIALYFRDPEWYCTDLPDRHIFRYRGRILRVPIWRKPVWIH